MPKLKLTKSGVEKLPYYISSIYVWGGCLGEKFCVITALSLFKYTA